MSIEITLYPRTASSDDLRQVLNELGYIQCEHLPLLKNWPEGTLNFHWFDALDFLSFDGVEASIFKPSDDEKRFGPCEWALHTRVRISGSVADLEHQHETIRAARKKFGGSLYNDASSGGTNRYTALEKDPRDAASRGIYLLYERTNQNISAVRFSLSSLNEGFQKFVGTDLESLAKLDPVRVLYNAVVPFAVASLESFFSECFKILLRYDLCAQEKLKNQDKKVTFEDVIPVTALVQKAASAPSPPLPPHGERRFRADFRAKQKIAPDALHARKVNARPNARRAPMVDAMLDASHARTEHNADRVAGQAAHAKGERGAGREADASLRGSRTQC